MKVQQKKRISQKLWGWICLAINCLITASFLAEKGTDYLSGGIILTALIICYGVIKIQADIIKKDFSGESVTIEYICVFLITFLSALKVSDYLSSISLLIVLAISSVIELLFFFLITYWHFIRYSFTQNRRDTHRKSQKSRQ